MGVEDLGRVYLQSLKDSAGEKDKTRGIVGVITLWGTVEIFPVEVLVGTDEINGSGSAYLRPQYAAFLPLIDNGHSKTNAGIFKGKITLENRPVRRQNQRYLKPKLSQSFVQRTQHIAKTAAFGEGNNLR